MYVPPEHCDRFPDHVVWDGDDSLDNRSNPRPCSRSEELGRLRDAPSTERKQSQNSHRADQFHRDVECLSSSEDVTSRGSKSSWSSPSADFPPVASLPSSCRPAPREQSGEDHVLFGSSASHSNIDSGTGSDSEHASQQRRQPSSQREPLVLDETGNVASLGSALHWEDQCKPCLFVHTKVGCQNGASCEFCHFPHKRKNKPRPCKGKRDRYRKLISRMEQEIDERDGEGGGGEELEQHVAGRVQADVVKAFPVSL